MKKIILISIILIIGYVFSGCATKITSLNPPLLKALDSDKVGKGINIEGTGYPIAKLLIFINGDYKYDAVIEETGSFTYNVNFDEEGECVIKTKQSYNEIISDFSNELKISVDLTPPDPNTLKIIKDIPDFAKQNELTISGRAEPKSFLVVSERKIEVDDSGGFIFNYNLKEGNNFLDFRLSDGLGNITDVLIEEIVKVDTIPPKIMTVFWYKALEDSLKETEEFVYIKYGDWRGWGGTANVPITGHIRGDFKKITLDGKQIYPDENGEIYQRVWLNTPHGLNKYKVIAEDLAGNVSSAYLEMSVGSLDEEKSNDILDKLDDLENKIDGMDY